MQHHVFKIKDRCRGRHVVALLISKDGEAFAGSNGVDNLQPVCPRRKEALCYERGEQWELCRRVCGQAGHAEAVAVAAAGKHADGGTVILFGHDMACPDCRATMQAAGVRQYLIATTTLS